MRARCLADRTFGMGTSAPSMRRARVVAETGTSAGMMGPVLSRGAGRSPAWPRGSRGSGRDDAEAHARGTLAGSFGTMRGLSERGRGLGWPFALAGVVLDVQGGAALRSEQDPHLGEGAALRIVRGVVVVLCVAALAKPRRHAQRHPLGKDVYDVRRSPRAASPPHRGRPRDPVRGGLGRPPFDPRPGGGGGQDEPRAKVVNFRDGHAPRWSWTRTFARRPRASVPPARAPSCRGYAHLVLDHDHPGP
jgi:hypothetical protein